MMIIGFCFAFFDVSMKCSLEDGYLGAFLGIFFCVLAAKAIANHRAGALIGGVILGSLIRFKGREKLQRICQRVMGCRGTTVRFSQVNFS